MNEKLDKYLCDKYPLIFEERKLSTQESCMGRGFECGNGWFSLISLLCHCIQQHIDACNKYPVEGQTPIPQFVALQVKEKFGALRIYYKGGDKYCHGLVDMAESISFLTCEVCGNGGPNIGHTAGWIQSLCPECVASEQTRDFVPNIELQTLMAEAAKERE